MLIIKNDEFPTGYEHPYGYKTRYLGEQLEAIYVNDASGIFPDTLVWKNEIAPSAPLNFDATDGEVNQITMSWDPPEYGHAIEYDVYEKVGDQDNADGSGDPTNPGVDDDIKLNTTAITDLSWVYPLTEGQGTYYVRASNPLGEANSTWDLGTSFSAPPKVEDFEASDKEIEKIVFTWTHLIGGVPPPTYDIYEMVGSIVDEQNDIRWIENASSGDSYAFVAGTTGNFYLRAINLTGSTPSNINEGTSVEYYKAPDNTTTQDYYYAGSYGWWWESAIGLSASATPAVPESTYSIWIDDVKVQSDKTLDWLHANSGGKRDNDVWHKTDTYFERYQWRVEEKNIHGTYMHTGGDTGNTTPPQTVTVGSVTQVGDFTHFTYETNMNKDPFLKSEIFANGSLVDEYQSASGNVLLSRTVKVNNPDSNQISFTVRTYRTCCSGYIPSMPLSVTSNAFVGP